MIGVLIRHEDIDIDRAGAAELAAELVSALRWLPLSAVYTSPVPGAIVTARPLASDHALEVQVRPALTALDTAVEATSDAQHRIVHELLTLARAHPGETVAIVMHASLIRQALVGLTTGETVGTSFEIQPGHVATIGITSDLGSVLSVNVPASEIAV